MIKIHNVFEKWPLEDKSIQSIITSPPYWSLRKYDIPDVQIGNWKGQHGLEPTYQQYIEHTRLWAKEAWRVLRDDGVFFLNLGDSYSGSNKGHGMNPQDWSDKQKSNSGSLSWTEPTKTDLPSKCKILIPHRVAIALIDDGWILRNDICWYKPNAMPESCRDRLSKKFEYVFMFVKQPQYYFDLDAVRIPSSTYETDKRCSALERARMKGYKTKLQYKGKSQKTSEFLASRPYCNPGDLWQINTQPSPFKHYAMWPEKLVERMILCSTRKDDTVLDPFAGSGATLYVAEKLNRKGMGFELGYQDIQKIRLSNIQKDLL